MSQPQSFDQLPRYVRVRSEPEATFVEFDFAIGYPDLFVELVQLNRMHVHDRLSRSSALEPSNPISTVSLS